MSDSQVRRQDYIQEFCIKKEKIHQLVSRAGKEVVLSRLTDPGSLELGELGGVESGSAHFENGLGREEGKGWARLYRVLTIQFQLSDEITHYPEVACCDEASEREREKPQPRASAVRKRASWVEKHVRSKWKRALESNPWGTNVSSGTCTFGGFKQ